MMHLAPLFQLVKSAKTLKLVGYLIIICLFMQIIACSHKQPVMLQKRIHFSAGDTSLYGMLALPAKRSGPVPIVIFVHGEVAPPNPPVVPQVVVWVFIVHSESQFCFVFGHFQIGFSSSRARHT